VLRVNEGEKGGSKQATIVPNMGIWKILQKGARGGGEKTASKKKKSWPFPPHELLGRKGDKVVTLERDEDHLGTKPGSS